MRIVLSIIIFITISYASDCGYPDWVDGATVYNNGDSVVYNSFIFEAHNSPGAWDTPPSDSIDSWFWYYSGVCSPDNITADSSNSLLFGFYVISFSAVAGLTIGVAVKLFKYV